MKPPNETIVFLGPSYPIEDAQAILPALYLPPISQGDLLGCLYLQPKLIIIIDGYFHRIPAVWHKEILYALKKGIRIIGAASMGALRACELEAFGMEGVGQIFHWYKSGEITGDDEVALLHGPKELAHQSLSIPLVNIRATLLKALKQNLISKQDASLILSKAKTIFYSERSINSLIDKLKQEKDEHLQAIIDWLPNNIVDQKSIDAHAALSYAKSLLEKPAPKKLIPFTFSNTVFFNDLLHIDTNQDIGNPQTITPGMIMSNERLKEYYLPYYYQALLLSLVDIIEQDKSMFISEDELDRHMQTFWHNQNITSPFGMRKWYFNNNITPTKLRTFIAKEIKLNKLFTQENTPKESNFLYVLKKRGLFPDVCEEVKQREAAWHDQITFTNGENIPDPVWREIIIFARKLVFDSKDQYSLQEISQQLGFDTISDFLMQYFKNKHGQNGDGAN